VKSKRGLGGLKKANALLPLKKGDPGNYRLVSLTAMLRALKENFSSVSRNLEGKMMIGTGGSSTCGVTLTSTTFDITSCGISVE